MFRRHWKNDIDGQIHHAIVWATYGASPRPLTQCLIAMAYGWATQLYVPCAYTVLTFKNEETHCTVLREIVVLTKYHWMPVSITVDFEKSLLNAFKQN
ncbi:hypothetical protein HZS_3784 [Henneguya salminicola]|nr:hypothetical protein HZS_3784 [Henneguya salminicola]